MKNVKRILWLLTCVGVVGITICALALLSASDKRSAPSRMVRWLRGEGGAMQEVNDLAETLSDAKVKELQKWAVTALDRFNTGNALSNGVAPYWALADAVLPPDEVPPLVKQLWHQKVSNGREEPLTCVRLDANRQAECVMIAWYLHGIAVGRSNYVLSFFPLHSVQLQPGVYVYARDK